jgi:trk system potassium uptake protein TrkA
MNIVIVGMGEVGRHVSNVLADEDHNVVIIDVDRDALMHAEDTIDAMVLNGHGANPNTLEEANVEAADLFIAVTDSSEINMLAAIRAKQHGADKTIARVADTNYFRENRGLVADMLGIDLVINPDTLIAVELHKLVRSVNAVAVEDFADNRIEMIQLPIDEVTSAVNRPLKDINLPTSTLVAAIIRDDRLIVPSGEDMIYPGDQVLGVGRVDKISEFEGRFNRQRKRFTNKVIVAGGSEISATFAGALADDGIDTILIERSFERCQEWSERLSDVF